MLCICIGRKTLKQVVIVGWINTVVSPCEIVYIKVVVICFLNFLNDFFHFYGKIFLKNLNDIFVTLYLLHCDDFLPSLLLFDPEVGNLEAVCIYLKREELIKRLLRLKNIVR